MRSTFEVSVQSEIPPPDVHPAIVKDYHVPLWPTVTICSYRSLQLASVAECFEVWVGDTDQ